MNNETLEAKLGLVIQNCQCIDGDVPFHFEVEVVEQIKQIFKDEGYEKKHHILYGTKYPDPRKCTKTSHFVEQEDCQCGYTKGMR